jgi:hypothetical protein
MGTGRITIWNLRTILERLHFDGNPMGYGLLPVLG